MLVEVETYLLFFFALRPFLVAFVGCGLSVLGCEVVGCEVLGFPVTNHQILNSLTS